MTDILSEVSKWALAGHINEKGVSGEAGDAIRKAAAPEAAEPVAPRFPTMLRKMWSGGEVQRWLDDWWAKNAAPTDSQAGRDAVEARRYRWLRDVSTPPHNFYLSVPVEFDGVKYSPEEVDAAIDAALSTTTGRAAE